MIYTEPRNKVCKWLREISVWPCLHLRINKIANTIFLAVADPLDLCVVPRLRGQLRRPHLPQGGAAQRGLVLRAGGGLGLAARVRVQGGDARAGLAVLRGRRLREVSQLLLVVATLG